MRAQTSLPKQTGWIARLSLALALFYLMVSLETITMLHYMGMAAFLAKLIRYLLYAAMILLWLYRFWMAWRPLSIKKTASKLVLYFLDHLVLSFLLVLSLLIYFNSGSLMIFALLLVFMTLEGLPRDTVLKGWFYSQLFCLIGVLLLCRFGILEDLTYPTYLRGTRHALGYIFPLELHVHFLFLCLLGLYIYRKKTCWTSFIIVSALNYILYTFTIARTSFFLTEGAALWFLLAAKMPKGVSKRLKDFKGWNTVLAWLLLAVFIVPCVLCLIYSQDNILLKVLNGILTNRLAFGKYALESYPVTLFGQTITWLGSGGPDAVYSWTSEYNFVDISYVKDLLDYGIIFFAAMYLGYFYLASTFAAKKNWFGLGAVLITLASGFMEPRLMQIPVNGMLLFMMPAVLADNARAAVWFDTVLPFGREWKQCRPLGRKILILTGILVLSMGLALFRQLHIYAYRRNFVQELVDRRADYIFYMETLNVPEGADPYLFRSLAALGLEASEEYYANILAYVDISNLSHTYIDDAAFANVYDLDSQNIERKFKVLMADYENLDPVLVEQAVRNHDVSLLLETEADQEAES